MEKKTLQIGIVHARQTGAERWQLRYRDPLTGRDVRRTMAGLTQKEITVIATHVNQSAMAETGYLPGKVEAAPTVKEGILEAIKLSKGNDATRKGLRERGNLFIAWIGEHHPEARTWDKVKVSHLQGYVNAMERDKLAYNTITHRLAIVKTAWRLMNADYPKLVRALPGVRRAAKVKRELDCLAPAEVAALLDWLQVHRPDLWPMATLQALAGLRMFEAAALRAQDVFLDKKLVHVTSTPLHTVKTATSDRFVPLCDEAVAALKVAMANQKIRPTGGELFVNADGEPWKKTALDHRWYLARQAAAADLFKLEKPKGRLSLEQLKAREEQAAALDKDRARFLGIPAHRLRASFATMASRLGFGDALLKRMLGHTGEDVLNQHYKVIRQDDLRGIAEMMNRWREKEIWQNSGNSLQRIAVND